MFTLASAGIRNSQTVLFMALGNNSYSTGQNPLLFFNERVWLLLTRGNLSQPTVWAWGVYIPHTEQRSDTHIPKMNRQYSSNSVNKPSVGCTFSGDYVIYSWPSEYHANDLIETQHLIGPFCSCHWQSPELYDSPHLLVNSPTLVAVATRTDSWNVQSMGDHIWKQVFVECSRGAPVVWELCF